MNLLLVFIQIASIDNEKIFQKSRCIYMEILQGCIMIIGIGIVIILICGFIIDDSNNCKREMQDFIRRIEK